MEHIHEVLRDLRFKRAKLADELGKLDRAIGSLSKIYGTEASCSSLSTRDAVELVLGDGPLAVSEIATRVANLDAYVGRGEGFETIYNRVNGALSYLKKKGNISRNGNGWYLTQIDPAPEEKVQP